MKAYYLNQPGELAAKETELPAIGDDEVLIKVAYVGLCGSDIHLYHGTYSAPHSYPMLFGHEWSGTVEKVGKSVTRFQPGDKVTGDCSKYCGTCKTCQTDNNLCESIEKYGITVDGATAEYIVRPEKHLYKADRGADMSLLALTEPIGVAKHLLERMVSKCGSFAGKRVLVYGGGAIGQAALMLLLHEYGCEHVDLYDVVPHRTELAAKIGASIPTAESLEWNGGDDYSAMYNDTVYDVILETTGVGAVFKNALNLLKPLGTLGCVGMVASVEIPQKLIVTKALTVVGSIGATGNFEQVIDFIAGHEDVVRELVSHCYDMENAQEAFAQATSRDSGMKILLKL